MTNRPDQTRAVYDEVAAEYADRISGELAGKPLDCALLDVFAKSISAGDRVCDAGCGPGHVSRYLRDRGVNVYGVDFSPAMVAEAIRRNPDIEFLAGDLTCLPVQPGGLAGVIMFYSLIHLPREEVQAALGSVIKCLRPNGLMLAAFHVGTGELHIDELWGRSVSLDFTLFRVDEMKEYLQKAGCALEWVVEREPYRGVEYPTRRGYILGRKADTGTV
ncbi:MAG: class I SAM-dependent methyltransferase [Desulfosalsimonadaceae bacterium]|nr:class I SAM-dependent methyltransferase [Desulfosalsimonadaceae bacterium]